jgi:hypothetical protein
MGRPKKNKEVIAKLNESTPSVPIVINNNSNTIDQHQQQLVNNNNNELTSKYVVIRDNKRVSEVEYDNPNDPSAIEEMRFWNKIIKRWPDGTKVEIVPFDKKKHRIW